MALNLSKLNAALNKLESKRSSETDTRDSFITLHEGNTILRLVPYKFDLEMPFNELYFHYDIAKKHFLCPKKYNGSECPICEFVSTIWEKYNETKDETLKKAATKIGAKRKVFVPVVVRGEEDKGIKFWGISSKDAYKDLIVTVSSALKQGIDVTDPHEGLDLTITISEVTKGFTYLTPTSINPMLKPTPLLKDRDKIQELLDTCPNLADIPFCKPQPLEDMKASLEKYLNPTEDEDNSKGTEKDFTKNLEDEELDFEKSEKKTIVKDSGVDSLEDQFAEILNSSSKK